MKTLTRVLCALALCAAFMTVPSCNTTKGVGTDIENAGSGLKHSAERNGAE